MLSRHLSTHRRWFLSQWNYVGFRNTKKLVNVELIAVKSKLEGSVKMMPQCVADESNFRWLPCRISPAAKYPTTPHTKPKPLPHGHRDGKSYLFWIYVLSGTPSSIKNLKGCWMLVWIFEILATHRRGQKRRGALFFRSLLGFSHWALCARQSPRNISPSVALATLIVGRTQYVEWLVEARICEWVQYARLILIHGLHGIQRLLEW